MNPPDDGFRRGAADVGKQLRFVAEPAPVRGSIACDHGTARAPQSPAVDLVNGKSLGECWLDRDPGMHTEIAPPAHGTRRIDLDDGLGCCHRVRCKPDGRAAGRAPVFGRDVRMNQCDDYRGHEAEQDVLHQSARIP